MPNRTSNSFFEPSAPLSREQLQRYARGELSPAEQHMVELHLEADPLLRDAVEGLRGPGAMSALAGLDTRRPQYRAGRARSWMIAGISALVLVTALWWLRRTDPTPPIAPPLVAEVIKVPETPAEHAAFAQELDRAVALPETLRSAARGTERFVQATDTTPPMPREEPPAVVAAREPEVVSTPPADAPPKVLPAPSSSRRVMFFYDLKLVRPEELYPVNPVLELAGRSVDARYSDAQAKAADRPTEQATPYDRFFKTAMGKYVRGDRQGCLEDLFLVLEQYPEDVNALFYGGLCCYDLGLFPRAASLLDRARHHKVDTFLEEAEWYHALAYERAYGRTDAEPLLRAVVERGGFYAERASKHLDEGAGK